MIPDISYSPAITVLKADTYKNAAWRSDTDYAVQINAGNQLIVFDTCKFVGAAEAIVKGWGGTRVRFINCGFYGSNPVDQWARAFNGYNVMQFEFINCYTEKTGGILIERWSGPLDAPLIVQYNQFRNHNNHRKDGSKGELKSGLMIKDTSFAGGLTNCDISYNDSINEFGNSLIEDNYNFFNAKGTAEKQIRFHHNKIRGAFPDVVSDNDYTGTGFTTDGDGTNKSFGLVTSYVLGYNNVFLDCMNSAVNIAIGHDVHFDDTNVILNSGLAPDGSKFAKAWAGCAIFNSNLTDETVFSNNSIKNNLIGSMHWGGNYKFKDRQDEMNDRGTGQWQNRMPTDQNRYMPDGSVTPAAIESASQDWYKMVAAAGIVLGPGTTVNPPAPTTDISLKLTQIATGIIQPVNAAGSAVPFKKTDIASTSGDATIFSVTTTDTGVIVKPLKAGKATLTVVLKTLSGKSITKTKSVEVLSTTPVPPAVDNEAVDFNIPFRIS